MKRKTVSSISSSPSNLAEGCCGFHSVRNFFAVTMIVFAWNASASDFSVNVDLSAGTLTNSRFSSGYLGAVSPGSFTLVGSDGTYYPNTTSQYSVNNDSFRQYVLSATPAGGATSIVLAPPNSGPGEIVDSNLARQIGLPGPGSMYAVTLPALEWTLDYDVAWQDIDTPGWDVGSGPGWGISSGNWSGHVTVSGLTNSGGLLPYLSYSNAPLPALIWDIKSLDNVGGPASLTVSNLTASASMVNVTFIVGETPEPETYAMMLAGLGLVGVATRCKKLAKV